MKSSCISDIRFFAENITSLNKTSEDSSKLLSEYMTESQVQVINFDGVKEAYFKSFGVSMTACSVDALVLQNDGTWAFVEFKNGRIGNAEKHKIRLKIKSSLLILCDLAKVNLDFTRKQLDMYLIYNHEHYSDDSAKMKISESLALRAKDENIKFSLSIYRDVFFRRIHTYSEIKFREGVKNILPISSATTFIKKRQSA